MRTALSQRVFEDPPHPHLRPVRTVKVDTTLLELVRTLQGLGFCDEQIEEAVPLLIEAGEVELLGAFRNEHFRRAA